MDLKKTFLSWAEVSDLADVVINKMRFTGWTPDVVVGLTRGGLLPATLISHRMNIEMSSLDISLSKKDPLIPPMSSWLPALTSEGYKLLIIDDINDTGETFSWIRQDWLVSLAEYNSNPIWPDNLVKFASLIHNFPSSQPTDFFGMEINKEIDPNWIVFPWENQNNDRQ